MINENEAISILCDYLMRNGYFINQQLDTRQKGVDIIAQKDKSQLFIEVKGETPASPTSKKFGKQFSGTQIKVHVAEAIYKTLSDIGKYENDIKFAIALPDTNSHYNYVQRVLWLLKKIGVKVYLIKKDSVREI